MSRVTRQLALPFCLVLSHALCPPPSHARLSGQADRAARAGAADSQARTSETLRRAIKRDKKDAEGWYEYGEALAREGDSDGALKALREAVKLYTRRFQNMRGIETSLGPEAAATRRAEIVASLRRAPEAVEKYVALESRLNDFERAQHEALAGHARMLAAPDARDSVFFLSELDSRAQITQRAEPGGDGFSTGRIRLRAVAASDGMIKHIFVLAGGRDTLTEKAVEAARRIRFKPAVKDGQPVSQLIMLEYNFNVF